VRYARKIVRRVAAISSLLVRLDRGAPATLQAQLAQGLREAIAGGRLLPGTRIPPSRALAAELAVSRATVVAAVLDLVGEGWLATRARGGTFVARELPDTGPAPAEARPAASPSALRLSSRAEAETRRIQASDLIRPRPLAFRLSRPALDAFPVGTWSRLLARRAARVSAGQLDYGAESPELRAAIATLVSSARGMRVEADQVFIFGGGQRALEFAAGAILDAGDRAWMEDPGYPGARTLLRAAGATVAAMPVDDEGLVVGGGAARLVYVTPSSQFPLGVTMSLARRQALLRWAARAGACILEDDYDCDFRYAGPGLPSLQALDPDRVLYSGSFSRTMFPALRLGFLVVPQALAESLRALRAALEDFLPSVTQLALADFIADGHYARHVRRMRVLYRERRDALIAAARTAGRGRLRLRPIGAGLHAVADLVPAVDAEAVAAAAARRGIEAAPLARFSAGRSAPAALVLGFGGVRADRAHAAMAELAAAIDEVS
jgi:GntR family transcriptional regulator / MocR family aminotransferase